jgi:hypothetical protein
MQVPHLASHVLGLIARRIRADLPAPRALARQAGWQAKYGHPVHALEAFVDRSRFRGTCYRAANWLRLGQTRGRTRNDCAHSLHAPVKDVYLYRFFSSPAWPTPQVRRAVKRRLNLLVRPRAVIPL